MLEHSNQHIRPTIVLMPTTEFRVHSTGWTIKHFSNTFVKEGLQLANGVAKSLWVLLRDDHGYGHGLSFVGQREETWRISNVPHYTD